MTIEPFHKQRLDKGEKGIFLVCCDHKGCHKILDFKDHSFEEVVNGIRQANWKIVYLFKTYLHYCMDHKPR